jgi:uncharacterized protein with PQ loop repeat
MIHTESTGAAVIGVLLILGSIISYVPQYYKIIKNENVIGISHWSQGLNNISAFSAFFGAFMLDYETIENCYTDDNCASDMIPFIQLLFVWLCPLINYIIFIKYYSTPPHVKSSCCNIRDKYVVYGFFGFYIFIFLICCLMTSIVLIANWKNWKHHAIFFGKTLNILSSLITAFVWTPQIYKTYKEKHIGSLSLLSLGIQAPGSFMIFIFQVVLSGSSWYIGFPYLITSLFQLTIFILGFGYERKKNAQYGLLSLYDDPCDNTNDIFEYDNNYQNSYEKDDKNEHIHEIPVHTVYDSIQ